MMPDATVPFVGQGFYSTVSSDKALAANIAYEIARLHYDHYDLFGNYHASAAEWTPGVFLRGPAPLEYFHPGARELMDERGLKLIVP